jgi:tetratricopeptide (TPR) repeat protein
MLSNLGATLRVRFERAGELADLDAAVQAGQAAVEATPTGHPNRATMLSNLGSALQIRFERVGELADLDAAVQAGRAAVDATPTGHPNQARQLSNLGVALRARYQRVEELADLDAAVQAGRAAVEAAPTGHPNRATMLSNLGAALLLRFGRVGELTDLDAAVLAGRAAVQATPTAHPNRAWHLSYLGATLRVRFERVGELEDLDAAVLAGRAAVDATPTGHPNHAAYLSNLGTALQARFQRTAEPADAETALTAWREATAVAAAPVSVRIAAGQAWGALAASRRQWSDAVDGYAAAVGLLPLLVWRGVGRRSRERLLADWGGLAADAAACAIAADRPGLAVELLEQGRGVLWSQLLETRTDLDALREADPELAARLDTVRAALDRPTAPVDATSDGAGAAGPATEAEARMALAREWDRLIDQARALPGFADFARPPAAAQLRRAATAGTVVIVNVSWWRCDALLVADTAIEVVELPDLTRDSAFDRANGYLRAVRQFRTSRRDAPAARIALEQAITAALEWLWDVVAEPVLNALGHRDTPTAGQPWPRVWWCPTGPLTILPLHAAGRHDLQGGRSVLDRVVSSYTPTLRALADVRIRAQPAGSRRLLLIALPNTPGQQRLPAVAAEQAHLTGLFNAEQRSVLLDAAATRSAILSGLSTHAWVHASCHGDQNLADPTRGGLLPYDWDSAGYVSVLDITASEHPGGEFVFLSACKTATGGVANLDEAINLAAALQYAGWRHVIATLWSVWDTVASEITSSVYPHLVRNGHLDPTHAALALHHTLRNYRDRGEHRSQPSRWAPFLHTGP